MIEKSCMKEQRVHGKKNFPFCVYHNLSDKQNILDYHWHDEAEFIFLAKGSATFYIDASPAALHAGEALFVRGGQIHSGRANMPGKCEFYSFVFDLRILENEKLGDSCDKLILPLVEKRYTLPLIYKSADSKFARFVIKALGCMKKAYFEKPTAYELSIISSLYAIIARAADCGKITLAADCRHSYNDYKKERFKSILKFIHENYNTRITISDMARHENLSVFHFCHFFKSVSGKTVVEYLNEYRIDRSSHILISSNDKIMDIAFECGFQNLSYFIKLFKKYKGCTPSEYRKRIGCFKNGGNEIVRTQL